MFSPLSEKTKRDGCQAKGKLLDKGMVVGLKGMVVRLKVITVRQRMLLDKRDGC